MKLRNILKGEGIILINKKDTHDFCKCLDVEFVFAKKIYNWFLKYSDDKKIYISRF